MLSGSATRGRRTFRLAILSVLLGVLPFYALPAQAATEPLYVTATGHFVHGVFRDFWDTKGSLANFGYPITEEYIDSRSGKVIQYYERARFERDNAAATVVSLGMLGREVAGDRVFATSAPIANTSTRRYFPETGQIVQYGFKETWERRGGLPIFGYPLSGEIKEVIDGTERTVQYFERARFEFHPQLPDGQRVLISLLGRTLAPPALLPPLAPSTQPPALTTYNPDAVNEEEEQPSLVRPLVPPAKSALIYPLAGKPGDIFLFTAFGFEPNEKVAFWINAPDGSILGDDEQGQADADGTLNESGLIFQTGPAFPAGLWSIVAQGIDSEHTAVAYFLIVGSSLNNADSITKPSIALPDDIDARSEPRVGLIGTVFFFDAYGFQPQEEVMVTVTAADGTTTNTVTGVRADANGSIRYAGLYYASSLLSPLGLYNMTAVGRTSGKRSVAYFVVTF
jgi:hypothetical protein